MGQKLGTVPPFWGGGALAQCGLGWGLPPYQVASWSIQPFGHNRHGPKIGGLCPFLGRGAASPSITMSLGSSKAYLPTKWHLDPSSHLATTDMGQKLGAVPLCWGGPGSPSNTMWPGPRPTCVPSFMIFHLDPSNRLATIHQRYRQDGDRQRCDSIRQTVLQMVAQKVRKRLGKHIDPGKLH